MKPAYSAAVAVACALLGCQSATTVLVAVDGPPLEQLVAQISVGGGAQASYPLSSGGAPVLPATVRVILPDLAQIVTVTVNALATNGRALTASGAVTTVPHQEVTVTLVLPADVVDGAAPDGSGADAGGGDGARTADAALVDAGSDGGGLTWSLVATAPQTLHAVWGEAPGDAYAVGDFGTILHLQPNGQWPPDVSGTTVDLLSVWAGDGDAVVGTDVGSILVNHGAGWTAVTIISGVRMTGMWGSSHDAVYLTEDSGTVRFATDLIDFGIVVSGTGLSFTSVSGSDQSDAWAVGVGGQVQHGGTVLGGWQVVDVGLTSTFSSIWVASASERFIVGAGGVVLHDRGSGFTVESSGTTANLYGVWGAAPDDVYAVGAGGLILHSTGGGTWTAEASGTNEDLLAVWGSGPDALYAVGQAGSILLGQ